MEDKKISQQINDIVGDKVKLLSQLFPSAVKDGQVDFTALKEELGQFEEVGKEKYELTWSGKQNAKKLAQENVINRTLNYIKKDSKTPDTTENLYIEGDNLEVLKLLRQNYYSAIKMIYIDPPYNTGNDFVYNDKFNMNKTESDIAEGTVSEDNERLQVNQKSTNRYHANWLNMMYPRLKIAKDLLTDDGVIFISIGDNEVANLKEMCDEILDDSNFVGCAGRISKKTNNQGDYWAPNFDYILTYTKNKDFCPPFFGGMNYNSYNLIEDTGLRKGEKYQLVRLYMTSLDPMRGCINQRYYIECPDGSFIIPPGENFPENICDASNIPPKTSNDKVWRWSYSSYLEKKSNIVLKQGKSSNVVGENGGKTLWNAYTKTYLNDVIAKSSSTPNSFIEEHINQRATHELRYLKIPFDYAKPTSLLELLCNTCQIGDKDIILDFFSGSATTAHAVMQLNAEDGGNRKFILVQIPEVTDEKSEAYNAGYKNICEIGKERIRRAGEKIKKEVEEHNAKLKEGEEAKKVPDIGFKVFRTADTNIKWNTITASGQLDMYTAGYTLDLADFILDAKDEDVVYEIMLQQNDVSLADTMEILTDIGKRTYLYASSYLVCLETEITEKLVEKLSSIDPLPIKFVFRDSAFKDNIDLKDETFRRLKSLIEKNSGLSKKTYTVEFI